MLSLVLRCGEVIRVKSANAQFGCILDALCFWIVFQLIQANHTPVLIPFDRAPFNSIRSVPCGCCPRRTNTFHLTKSTAHAHAWLPLA